jgi:hypothetical protein
MEFSGQIHDPAALPQQRTRLNRKPGGPQRRYGRFGEKIPCPSRDSNPRSSSPQPNHNTDYTTPVYTAPVYEWKQSHIGFTNTVELGYNGMKGAEYIVLL